MERSETSAVLATDRLLLRALRASDAAAIAAGIGDWDVARWLPQLPWPYALKDAEDFLQDPVSIGAWLIEMSGQTAGVVHIGVTGELGYWLGRPFHGHGYMTEAAGALVARHFASGGGDLISGYLLGNAPSCNVLTKLGFSNTHIERKHARPLDAEVDIQRMALTAADWRVRQAEVIRTARLILRPLRPEDAPAIAGGIGDWDVIRWLTTPPWPYALADAEWFIGDATSDGAMMIEISGTAAGIVSINADGDLGYWLARTHHGHGYMTEAAGALVARHFQRGGGPLISGYLLGNDRSCKVLTKLGFSNTHIERSLAKPLNAEVDIQRMALTAEGWAARRPLDIKTARLILRAVNSGDESAVVAALNDPEVSCWLATVPHPYEPADFRYFLAEIARAGETFAVDDAMGFVGMVGVEDGELGYWFARHAHAKGYATEAARAAVAEWFARTSKEIVSGYFEGNARSANVLRKLGFVEFGHRMRPCRALAQDRPFVDMVLTAEEWAARNPLIIETARLVLRPHVDADAPALSRLGGVPEVARMMSTLGAPWPEAEVLDWMAGGRWRGVPGFRLAICRKDGTLIGSLGLGGTPVGCAYFLGRDHWGQGYATEAMRAFLAEVFARFGLTEIEAGAYEDNPASMAVLRKLGFVQAGSEMGTSKARLEPAPIRLYRLTQTSFKAANP